MPQETEDTKKPGNGTATDVDPEEARRAAAERALKANANRNAAQLARREQIADSAEGDSDHGEMLEVTDEMYDELAVPENVRNARAIARAMAEGREEGEEAPPGEGEEEAETEEEERPRRRQASDEEPENDQDAEAEDDAAREAGADDVRIVDGVKQYRIVVNGNEKWLTLGEIKAKAQKVDAADEYLENAVEAARTATRTAPTAEETAEAGRQKAERLAHRKQLLKAAALGDEAAIDELAELLDAAPPAVTPDVLQALDQRADSRATFREAVTWFESEFSQELKHQAMKSYAGELDAALAAKFPKMAPKDRLQRVGNQIRKELQTTYGIVRGRAKEAGPSDKARRKAEGSRLPERASERPRAEESGDETETYSSAIQKIAQGRHQPRAVVHGPIRNR